MIAVIFLMVFGTMIGEAVVAARNERAQLARGGLEPSGDVYKVMRIVYPGMFAAMFAETAFRGAPPDSVAVAGVAIFAAAKALKWWAIASLGPFWTFRVIVVPGASLVVKGPYRWLRHPNYVGVIGEIAGAAAMLNAPIAGAVSLVLFSGLLVKRVAVEERALAEAQRATPVLGPIIRTK
jgi:methyltransferase